MKKFLTAGLAVLFACTHVFAQDALTHDPEAKKVLDKVSAHTKTMKTISIVFKYKVENKQDGVSESFDGYAFMKGNKYKIIIPGNEIISDGKTVWSVMNEAEEVTISEPGPDDDSLFNPAKLFTIYESGFKYKYLGEENKQFVIDLFPEKANEKNFSRVRLHIDKVKSEITSIKTFRKDGYDYTIDVSNFMGNNDLPESLFSFKKESYSNYEIVDMR